MYFKLNKLSCNLGPSAISFSWVWDMRYVGFSGKTFCENLRVDFLTIILAYTYNTIPEQSLSSESFYTFLYTHYWTVYLEMSAYFIQNCIPTLNKMLTCCIRNAAKHHYIFYDPRTTVIIMTMNSDAFWFPDYPFTTFCITQ